MPIAKREKICYTIDTRKEGTVQWEDKNQPEFSGFGKQNTWRT